MAHPSLTNECVALKGKTFHLTSHCQSRRRTGYTKAIFWLPAKKKCVAYPYFIQMGFWKSGEQNKKKQTHKVDWNAIPIRFLQMRLSQTVISDCILMRHNIKTGDGNARSTHTVFKWWLRLKLINEAFGGCIPRSEGIKADFMSPEIPSSDWFLKAA